TEAEGKEEGVQTQSEDVGDLAECVADLPILQGDKKPAASVQAPLPDARKGASSLEEKTSQTIASEVKSVPPFDELWDELNDLFFAEKGKNLEGADFK
ncbi:hypothetical protein GN156_25730, partial [bacterium LRH843]|nr:hypothetical protein [bacterium LRH843]